MSVSVKRRRRRHRLPHGPTKTGTGATHDQVFGQGLRIVEKLVQWVMLPIALIGSAVAFLSRELLSHRFYPFFGGVLAVFGLALSAESYWVGLGSGHPFIPKLGLQDGASFDSLLAVLNGPLGIRLMFAFLVGTAVVLQVIESVPWRLKMAAKKRFKGRGGVSFFIWVLVVGGYALDLYSCWQTYHGGGLSVPSIVYGALALIGAELGLALAEQGAK